MVTESMFSTTTLVTIITSITAIAVGYYFLAPGERKILKAGEFQEFPLIQKVVLSHNTAFFRFGLPRPNDILGLPIGQHIQIGANLNGKEVLRSYTPTSIDQEAKGYFDLLIKVYPNGLITKYMDSLKLGDTIRVKGPRGHFQYEANKWEHLCMVSGGTGITPMYQVIKAICLNPLDKTKVTLLYGSLTEEDILLKPELDKLVAGNSNINVVYFLNEAPENWTGGVGFITKDVLSERFPTPDINKNKLLLCGPPPMVSALKKGSNELGWEKARPVSKADDHVFVF
ncbi:cytochrome-b5 reductase [Martiniozyma asiatica (nom. inval.)]|nr:cytochrome-b5 reductase [Martiniozyma asiatica]